ncbi:MAG: superoxide dismutase [Cu-Zn] SodC [Rhodospirillales bacterium]
MKVLSYGTIAAFAALGVWLTPTASALSSEVSVKMYLTAEKGQGKYLGKVYFKDGPKGLIIKPRLKGLPSGDHGFHVHEKRSCKAHQKDGKPVPGLAAGGHYDPQKTGKHEGPDGTGHLGDLPILTVGKDGMATGTLSAPRLKVADLKKRSLMIHAGGDNFSDTPKPLGGGGARLACGLF